MQCEFFRVPDLESFAAAYERDFFRDADSGDQVLGQADAAFAQDDRGRVRTVRRELCNAFC